MQTDRLWTFEGDLYRKDRGYKEPLRRDYDKAFGEIKTATQFKSTLRHGPYTWPGCYPLYFITSDGGAICFKCARSEARSIIDAIKKRYRDGWKVEHCEVNYESEIFCDHCNEKIESAYGDD
jgi:hypothetical protein